jgi:acyl CoA:acetate/3-ketoacid CoA transferase beta subunit
MTQFTRADSCVIACAEIYRGDGEILANPTVGSIPFIGARLARATFEPDLLMTDGESMLVAGMMPVGAPAANKVVEGWLPYRMSFDQAVWPGRRHVVMGASQVSRYGDTNIAAIGPWERPTAQLLGARGAPGNTVNHATSYWIPNHSVRVFVADVDFVSGLGPARASRLGGTLPGHNDIRRVVTNLCVIDFESPGCAARLRSIHPGVTLEEVIAKTGFPLVIPNDLGLTRAPTEDELRLIRDVIDPTGTRLREVPE